MSGHTLSVAFSYLGTDAHPVVRGWWRLGDANPSVLLFRTVNREFEFYAKDDAGHPSSHAMHGLNRHYIVTVDNFSIVEDAIYSTFSGWKVLPDPKKAVQFTPQSIPVEVKDNIYEFPITCSDLG